MLSAPTTQKPKDAQFLEGSGPNEYLQGPAPVPIEISGKSPSDPEGYCFKKIVVHRMDKHEQSHIKNKDSSEFHMEHQCIAVRESIYLII